MRIGRLPPRDGRPSAGPGTPARPGAPGVGVLPTVPRKPFVHARWSEADALATRLGLSLDPVTRKVVRSVVEHGSTLSTELRGARHDLAGLVGGQLVPQPTLVIGAEVSALSDLRERLLRAGATAVLLDEGKGAEPIAADLERIARGDVKNVLATPKWLARDAVVSALGKTGIGLVIVDGAERCSPWSHAFLPQQARLATYLERLGKPPVLALAPGASSAVRHDLEETLLPSPPHVFDGPLVRPNVALVGVRARGEARQRALVDLVRKLPRPLLVLAQTPRDVEAIHGALRSVGLPAHRYHEELATGVRAGEQLQFSMPGERAILVATSAFAPGAPLPADDSEGVPLRYGRKTTKNDIRSLVRLQAPASPEQLVEELALIGRDGERAEAVVFHDPSDRPALEAELEDARPTGAQLLLLGRALESASAESAVMTESLALAARSSLRTIESLGRLLDAMGLVSQRDGWLRRLAPEQVLSRELRSLAERFATVRALDGRRLGEMSELCLRGGCLAAGLRRALGDPTANPCGVCSACAEGRGAAAVSPRTEVISSGERHAPARRFTVATVEAGDATSARTFRSDAPGRQGVLTAKLADFK